MTHLVNECCMGLVSSAVLLSLQIPCSARRELSKEQKKYRNKSVGSSQFGISIHITLIGAGPRKAFLSLIFCQLSPGYCSFPVREQKQTPMFPSRKTKSQCINMKTGLLPSSSHKLGNGAQEAEILERP